MLWVIASLSTQGSCSSSAWPLGWATRCNRQQEYLYKLFVLSSLSCQVAHWDKARCRKAPLSYRDRELEAQCAVQGLLFSTLFIDLYGFIYFSSCFSFFCKFMGFFFNFFSSSNCLIDFLRLQISFKWLITIRIIFSWLLVTLQIAVYFNFITILSFFAL